MALIPALERQRQSTSVSLRSAWSAKWISGQSWFHSETLPHKYQKQQQQGKQIDVFLFFPPKTLLRLPLLEEFVYPIDCPSWWDMWLWDSVCEYLPSDLQNLSLGTDGGIRIHGYLQWDLFKLAPRASLWVPESLNSLCLFPSLKVDLKRIRNQLNESMKMWECDDYSSYNSIVLFLQIQNIYTSRNTWLLKFLKQCERYAFK